MKETSVAFTGDIAFSQYYKDRFDDPELVGRELADFLSGADYGVFNVEGALCTPKEKGTFLHSSDPRCAEQIKRLHGNIWNLANNHIFDAGEDGCAETIALAKQCGFQTIGAGMDLEEAARPVILPEAGGIGLFGAVVTAKSKRAGENESGCLYAKDYDTILATVREIKKTCRWCVMVLHGGRAFCDIPMKSIVERYRLYLKMGVDVVVAHHPHVPQNYERVGENKYIFYSLGNFIFDTDYQRAQPHTGTGVLLKLFFTDSAVRFEAVGTKIDRTNGHIAKAELPAVFTELTEADYDRLGPLVATRFMEHIRKRAQHVKPGCFAAFDEADWAHFWLAEDRKYGEFLECLPLQRQYDGKPLGEAYRKLEEYLI